MPGKQWFTTACVALSLCILNSSSLGQDETASELHSHFRLAETTFEFPTSGADPHVATVRTDRGCRIGWIYFYGYPGGGLVHKVNGTVRTSAANFEINITGILDPAQLDSNQVLSSVTFNAREMKPGSSRQGTAGALQFKVTILDVEFADDAHSRYWLGSVRAKVDVQEAAVPQAAKSDLVAGRTYVITSGSSRKLIEVQQSGAGNDLRIQQASSTGSANQLWRLVPAGGDAYKIVSQSSGKVMEVPSTVEGMAIQPASDNGKTNQHWRIVALGNGIYKIVSQSSGKMLGVKCQSGNGDPIQQFTGSSERNQLWYFRVMDPSDTVANFTATGEMTAARYGHDAVLLPSGEVLIVGPSFSATVELYDSASGSFRATGAMNEPRGGNTTTALPDGKVLIAGGSSYAAAHPLTSAELYNPETGNFASSGAMSVGRVAHTATLLANGKVLIAGGIGDKSEYLRSAELYDPLTGNFASTGAMSAARSHHTATLLPNGKVLIAGGFAGWDAPDPNPARAELYDPGTGTFSPTGSMIACRTLHTATLLPNGKVLITDRAGAELYDIKTETFTATGATAMVRTTHTATLLANGKVLIIGGGSTSPDDGPSVALSTAELYDPATGSFTRAGAMTTVREYHSATLLPNGKVLVVGGDSPTEGVLSSAELYSPPGAVNLTQQHSKAADANSNSCQAAEDELQHDFGSVALHEKTISCYFRIEMRDAYGSEKATKTEKMRMEHVRWLIQHAPEDEFAGTPHASIDPYAYPGDYASLKQEWMSQVQAYAGSANVLVNAAYFVEMADADTAEKLASKAHALDPKNLRAMQSLATLLELRMNSGKPELKAKMAQRALRLREQPLETMTPEQKTGSSLSAPLRALATDAFEAGDDIKAQKYAEALLRLVESQDEKQWYYGNALHHGNLVLGRIALKKENLEEAKDRLLAAGKTPGSPQLDSFGPNMMLAKELLEQGQREVVLQYLDECAKFWQMKGDSLDQWKKAIREGRTPDFGANLHY